jgi:tetratricopeptide (TPR) repeat protein
MRVVRLLTLVWPGLPWLWLRGSLPGIVLALAFAVTLDVAMVTTWIWTDLVELPFKLAAWAGAAAIWLLGTASALSAFPPPLARGRSAEADALFLQARDAYLARDWARAEDALAAVLASAPTDGEAQLLLATLLRRVGRHDEARAALRKLSASDSGRPWRHAIAAERDRLDAATAPADNDHTPASLPLPVPRAATRSRGAAA